ncbi:hypothetical protein KIN20_009260 [Parelaphostrongylus tenuis]|uniref:Claspin n=1 Tax=Parelaphostrongylus tenuis TaxID=148309 RepID=A0AAD5M652_PARTN|nr:hypothetical protein KIN20_009260 [Parelaphostrongylus tenuis]
MRHSVTRHGRTTRALASRYAAITVARQIQTRAAPSCVSCRSFLPRRSMEVDGPDCPLSDATDSQTSQALNSSASSLANTVENAINEGKTRRLNRRLALANLQIPKLTRKLGDVIDLTSTEDDPNDLEWLKKKFPSIKDESKNPATSSSPSAKGTLPSITTQKSLKQLLEKKLAERRMTGLAKRKELYMKDNEDILCEEQEEEDDELEERAESRRHIQEELDEGGEDDEDYNADDEEDDEEASPSTKSESDGNEEEETLGSTDQVSEMIDSLDRASTDADANAKTSSNEMVRKNEIYNSANTMTQPVFPNSLSQWFGDKTEDEEGDEVIHTPVPQNSEFVIIGTFSNMDPFKDNGEDDVLMFCSGRFDSDNLTRQTDECVKSDEQLSGSQKSRGMTSTRKRKLVVESDEEDNEGSMVPPSESGNLRVSVEVKPDSDLLNGDHETKSPVLRRTVVDSDSELSGHSLEAEMSHQEEDEDGDEENIERGSNYIDDEADSDDELAVVRKLEKNDQKRKIKREKWFDDEASLSGDDVGSGLDDDDDLPNEYEAEEGDADDVPDSEVIRRQNHKLLLKQENDRDYQELLKLQDRLLADGDLGSLETNRTFRLKLRENMDVEDGVKEDADSVDKEKDEAISQASAQRVSAIKWFLEHEEEYRATCEDKNQEQNDDLFEFAARSVHISTHVSVNMSRAPRTLIGLPSLGNAVKETPGSTGIRQFYVNSTTIGAQKRPSSPVVQAAKKGRESVSVLSVLEQF